MKISIIYINLLTNAQCSFPSSISKRQTTSLQRLRTTHLCCDISKEKKSITCTFLCQASGLSCRIRLHLSKIHRHTVLGIHGQNLEKILWCIGPYLHDHTSSIYIYEKHWQGEKIVYMYAKEIAYNSRILNHTYNDYMNRCFLKNAVDCGCPHIQRNNATVDGGCPQVNIN